MSCVVAMVGATMKSIKLTQISIRFLKGSENMTKIRNQSWKELPHQSRQAATLYPHLTPPEVQREMLTYAQREQRGASLEKRMRQTDGEAMRKANWLQAEAPKPAGKPDPRYLNVPGLKLQKGE